MKLIILEPKRQNDVLFPLLKYFSTRILIDYLASLLPYTLLYDDSIHQLDEGLQAIPKYLCRCRQNSANQHTQDIKYI